MEAYSCFNIVFNIREICYHCLKLDISLLQLQKVLQKANRYPRHGDFEEFTAEAEAEAESPEYAAALTASSQSVTEVKKSNRRDHFLIRIFL